MIFKSIDIHGVNASLSIFVPEGERRTEIHAILIPTDNGTSAAEQIYRLNTALKALPDIHGIHPTKQISPSYVRFMLSDITNQVGMLPKKMPCAMGTIGQPPLCGVKAAVFAIFESDNAWKSEGAGIYTDNHGQLWHGDDPATLSVNHDDISRHSAENALTAGYEHTEDSRRATIEAFKRLESTLGKNYGIIRRNCLRTWFFVRDVDTNYAGVVRGRNEVFRRMGLSRDSHFIASTGINGDSARWQQTVSFNAYCDMRIDADKALYVKGASHLNATAEYGVAFERATAVDYSDRRRLFISGTASIDNRGDIVCPGDIEGQTLRMLDNIHILLQEAGCGWSETAHFIVYLRDLSDYPTVERLFNTTHPDIAAIPRIIVHAPVCRPGWLIETECMAIARRSNPGRPDF